jgi:hypothetical protein
LIATETRAICCKPVARTGKGTAAAITSEIRPAQTAAISTAYTPAQSAGTTATACRCWTLGGTWSAATCRSPETCPAGTTAAAGRSLTAPTGGRTLRNPAATTRALTKAALSSVGTSLSAAALG